MAADAGVVLCATTNPLCYPVIAVDYALRAWRLRAAGAGPFVILRRSTAARSAVACGLLLAASMVGMTQLEVRPNHFLNDPLDVGELIEAVVARPLLYPIVFPWYGQLGDATAVAAAAGLAGLAWWLTAESRGARALVAALAATAAYAAAATVATRPGLTLLLDEYRTTLLDRYYYGTSLLVVVAVCVAASAGMRGTVAVRRRAALAVVAALGVTYASHLGQLVEFRRSRWHDPPSQSFASALAAAAASTPAGADRVRVPLHPRPWRARFPAANVRATLMAGMPDTVIR